MPNKYYDSLIVQQFQITGVAAQGTRKLQDGPIERFFMRTKNA